jgi:hypothetical protein
MTPHEYFQTIVEPTVNEHFEHPSDVRRALLACLALYHTVDAVAGDGPTKAHEIAQDFMSNWPAFRLVKGACLSLKHINVQQVEFSDWNLQQFEIGRGAAFSDGSYYSDGSTHSDAPAAVVRRGTSFDDISHAIKEVTVALREKFGSAAP